MERERYGRGGGGGINRYPDVSGRTQQSPAPRDDRGRGRGDRPASAPVGRSSNEPWSDVPPELEAMLRAQVAQKSVPGPVVAPASDPVDDHGIETMEAAAVADVPAPTATRTRATRKPAARSTTKTAASKASPKARSSSKSAASTAAVEDVADGVADVAAPKARTPRKTAAPKGESTATAADAGEATKAPAKRRSPRKPSTPAESD
jgi:hypothetical protein